MQSLLTLATVWVIIVSPEGGRMPPTVNTRIDNVEFSSADDCNDAAKKWLPQLTNAAHSSKHSVTFGEQKNPAPDGATATYTCVAQDRK